MDIYRIKQLKSDCDSIVISVPASKSVLSRALILAAFTEGDTYLTCSSYAEDTKTLLACLEALGISVIATENGLLVHGKRDIPNKNTRLHVGSAGTAARFLTAVLAFRGGNYEIYSSEQMENRPMEFLSTLEQAGVRFEYYKKVEHFPFRMTSEGISAKTLTINTDVSTQYASGVLLAAAIGNHPFCLLLEGTRANGSYIATTEEILRQFGASCNRMGNQITIEPIRHAPTEYNVEPDVSGACYFYALSLLCQKKVLVRGVNSDCTQADMQFLKLLQQKGVTFTSLSDGLEADGSAVTEYTGFDVNMRDFSDQTLTVAALAPFATTPTVLHGVEHIRKQECDRVNAILENLTALGVTVSYHNGDVYISPSQPHASRIRTYNDHRVAMAFSLIGLKTGQLEIENPNCCKKTFENYFNILDALTE